MMVRLCPPSPSPYCESSGWIVSPSLLHSTWTPVCGPHCGPLYLGWGTSSHGDRQLGAGAALQHHLGRYLLSFRVKKLKILRNKYYFLFAASVRNYLCDEV